MGTKALQFLLAIFLIFDPRWWMPLVRGARSVEGWSPPLLLLVIVGSIKIVGDVVDRPIIAAFLYAWIASWGMVISISAALAFFDSLRNVRRFVRFGLGGYQRARLWFEIARSFSILGVVFASLTYMITIWGLPFAELSVNVLSHVTTICLAIFFIAATLGYVSTLMSRGKGKGRAWQCVKPLYLLSLGGLTIAAIFFPFRSQLDDPSVYLPLLMTVAGTCLLGALAFALADRWKLRAKTEKQQALADD